MARILITSGPTRQYLDPVRYPTNGSRQVAQVPRAWHFFMPPLSRIVTMNWSNSVTSREGTVPFSPIIAALWCLRKVGKSPGMIWKLATSVVMASCIVATACAESWVLPAPLTIPRSERPAWLREEGIVMAGSWEPLLFRARRLNYLNARKSKPDRGFEATPEQVAAYQREHTSQMISELKKIGVNFIMVHCYKGGGLQAERSSMEDAKNFTALAHKNGMHVGVYLTSGTSLLELMRKEHPDSADWEVLDSKGQPKNYAGVPYRHYINRNHPEWQEHLKPIMRYAIEEIQTDLLHFDNYHMGPGFDRNSVERFRDYLRTKYKPADFGLTDFESVQPPKTSADSPKLDRAWADFSSYSTAKSFYDVGQYARSLRPDILMELNPKLSGRSGTPIDLGRILRYGEASWNEVRPPVVGPDGKVQTHISSYKAAQAMDNIVFAYITCPVEAAESLAYNTDCLGCIAWFEWGKIVDFPDSDRPVASDIFPYVEFFHHQRAYYRDAERIADIAVLRSFASHTFVKGAYHRSDAMEQKCIESKIPWTAVYDHQLETLDRFPCLSVVGADALSSTQIDSIVNYVKRGGGLIYSEESGMYDEDMQPRAANPFAALNNKRVVPELSIPEFVEAISVAGGRTPSLRVAAPDGVASELCAQAKPKRRIVHLVNYKPDAHVSDVQVDLAVPEGWKVRQACVLSPESPNPKSLPFEQTDNRVSITVPRLVVYALISVESE